MYIDRYETCMVVTASEGYVLALRGDTSGDTFTKRIQRLDATIDDLVEIPKENAPVFIPEINESTSSMSVGELQQYLILQSKVILQGFLQDNPLEFEGKFYSVTSDAQAHLISIIQAAQQAANLGITYTPMWNAIDEVRSPYQLDFLQRLFIEIQNYILTFVIQQQIMEQQILTIDNTEDLLQFSILYKKEDK